MKRDWEIIREILMTLEQKNPDERHVKLSDFPEEKHFDVSYCKFQTIPTTDSI